MKKATKLIALIIALTLCLTACGGNTSTQQDSENPTSNSGTADAKTYTIGVARISVDEAALQRQEYLEKVVGPALNLNFIFSEAISDANALTTFIENAYAAGADGILSCAASYIEQGVVAAENKQLYITTQSSKNPDSIASSPYNVGGAGSSIEDLVVAYNTAVKSVLGSEPHNVIVCSGVASRGVTSQIEGTVSILQTLQEMYGLTYDQELEDIAVTSAPLELNTGKDMKVLVYPGTAASEGYLSGFSSYLQTGDYDVVASVAASYATLGNAIDEVEKALGFDILHICNISVSDAAATAFRTIDSTGNTAMNGGIVISSIPADGVSCVLRNALDGYADEFKVDGKTQVYRTGVWAVTSAEDYEFISHLDNSEGNYCLDTETLQSMCKLWNPDLNADDFSQLIRNATDLAKLIERFGN
jgi:hypothetical protein